MHAVELAMVQHMYSPNNVFNVTWPKYFINIILFSLNISIVMVFCEMTSKLVMC